MNSKELRKNTFRFLVLVIAVVALPISMVLVGNKTNFLNRAYLQIAGKNSDLKITLTSTKPFAPNWANYSQGGESSEGMLAPAVTSMRKLAPGYIRVDHVFDFYEPVARGTNGELTFDWTKLDLELKAISDMGAKPFISLSYMPSTISGGTEVDLPRSWAEWGTVVRATIEHISGRRGLGISDVYYEVWNEPDLFGGFKLRGAKNYLSLYENASRGAQSASNVLAFKFGGPGTTALYKNWVYDLLTHIRSNNLRMDFYSWHKYSAFLSDYQADINNLVAWRSDISELGTKELIITESGHTPEVDSGYDTKFSAVHTLAMLVTNMSVVDKVFTFEVIDGLSDKKYWGRWGLLTHPKWGEPEEKVRFKAMQFINQMATPGLAVDIQGQGDFVKAFGVLSGQSLKLFIVNYDPSGKHYEKVPISLTGLSDGEYNYRYSEFLGENYEIPVLISGQWNTYVMLKPNTAVIIEIIR